jgi:hypothetical protein
MARSGILDRKRIEGKLQPIFLMQKRLLLTLGLLLSSSLPAGAQAHSAQLSHMQKHAAQTTLVSTATIHLSENSFVPAPSLEQPPSRFAALLSAVHNRDTSLGLQSTVEVVKTPFVRQVRVTIVQFWGGRLRLDGFESTLRTRNFLLGLSESGGDPAFRVPHAGAAAPRAARLYGVSVMFRPGHGPRAQAPTEGWRRLACIAGVGRGCGP